MKQKIELFKSRGSLVLILNLFLLFGGILGSILWTMTIGLISLLLMIFSVLFLLIVQRRQIGILQKRVLGLIRSNKNTFGKNYNSKHDDGGEMALERIVGLLQAQQIGMDRIYDKVESISRYHHEQ